MSKLPERASLEYLRKLAKDRLIDLRREKPDAKLAEALLVVAREHGFPSWRALKAEIEARTARAVAAFVAACGRGDLDAVRAALDDDPGLIRAAEEGPLGATGLHAAARHGRLELVRLLIERGADPDARDRGDNAQPLHFAAGYGHLEVVRALLDAGGDVHGRGDLHESEVIGWATAICAPDAFRPEVAALLVERGARHHIFSAIALGDAELVRSLIEHDPDALDRRMSRFEHGQTALHFAMGRGRTDILDLLIELGADLEAEDHRGQTALAAAMLRGDREAMTRLHAAGARPPAPADASSFRASMASLGSSVTKAVPMIAVADIAASLDWYVALGFTEGGRYSEDDVVNFGVVSFGKAELSFRIGKPGPRDTSLWFFTDKVDELYQSVKARQLAAAQAVLAGRPATDGLKVVEELYDPFYGGRQFSIEDPDGYHLVFYRPEEP